MKPHDKLFTLKIQGKIKTGVAFRLCTGSGYSIKRKELDSIKLIAMIKEKFKKDLPFTTLFKASTIEGLSEILRSHEEILPWSPLVQINADGRAAPFFCIPGVGGNVFYLYELASQLELPFYGLQAKGQDGRTATPRHPGQTPGPPFSRQVNHTQEQSTICQSCSNIRTWAEPDMRPGHWNAMRFSEII